MGGVCISPWSKVDKTIEWFYPAAAALIQIGPEGSEAVIRAWQNPILPENRLCAIFVVAHVRGAPNGKAFLQEAIGESNTGLRNEAGLAFLKTTEQPESEAVPGEQSPFGLHKELRVLSAV